MSKQPHRLLAVTALMREKQSAWADAVEARKQKEKQREEAIHAALKQHATTIIDYLNSNPALFKPDESNTLQAHASIALADIPDDHATARAWNVEYGHSTLDWCVKNKILEELMVQLRDLDGASGRVAGFTNSHIVISIQLRV